MGKQKGKLPIGRPKSLSGLGPNPTSMSRQSFGCVVPGCIVKKRSDKLRNHYTSKVHFDKKTGLPIQSNSMIFLNLTQEEKDHTKYFYDHGYTITRLPVCSTPTNVPKNPFVAAQRKVTATETLEKSQGQTNIDQDIHMEEVDKESSRKTCQELPVDTIDESTSASNKPSTSTAENQIEHESCQTEFENKNTDNFPSTEN